MVAALFCECCQKKFTNRLCWLCLMYFLATVNEVSQCRSVCDINLSSQMKLCTVWYFYWNTHWILQNSLCRPLNLSCGFPSELCKPLKTAAALAGSCFLWIFDKHHPWNKHKCSWSEFYWQLLWRWHYTQMTSPCWPLLTATALLTEQGSSFPQHTHTHSSLQVLFSGALLVYGFTLVTWGVSGSAKERGERRQRWGNTA